MSSYNGIAMTLITCMLAAPAIGEQALQEKCDGLLGRWKERFDEEKLIAVVSPPFVVAGDGGMARVRAYRDWTVTRAATSLWKQFFKARPTQPVLILLFEDAPVYRRLSKKWFNDGDPPHFGYFRHDDIMVMNVGTGTGTLVHELTHALIKPDFPKVPSWFNEGFASLFEQCTFGADGTIRGLENWRLPGLQKAIKENKLRSFSELIEDPSFYRESMVGINYAQARYLMLYFQEKGQLATFYTRFRDGVGDDPTGLATLKKQIEPKGLDEFEKEWKAWVMGLKYER